MFDSQDLRRKGSPPAATEALAQPIGTENEHSDRGAERKVDKGEDGERWVHGGLLSVRRTASLRRTRKLEAYARETVLIGSGIVRELDEDRGMDPGPTS